VKLVLEKVIFYIDGLNLYNGLKNAGLRKYYWLNLNKLSKSLLKKDFQELAAVKYFTSVVYPDENFDEFGMNKYQRQNSYLKALKTLPNLHVFLGRHQKNELICNSCGHKISKYSEKMTDVKISVEMLKDAFQSKCSLQVLVTGDTDLLPVAELINSLSKIKLLIFAPPYRKTSSLSRYCYFYGKIFLSNIRKSQLPEVILNQDGFKIEKPKYWD